MIMGSDLINFDLRCTATLFCQKMRQFQVKCIDVGFYSEFYKNFKKIISSAVGNT